MKRLSYVFRLFFGGAGFFLLFIFDFIFIFSALAILSLGLVVFPGSLLGIFDVLPVITDWGLPVLMLGGLGGILLGIGMCLSAVFVCIGSVNLLHSFRKGTEWKKKRLDNDEAET